MSIVNKIESISNHLKNAYDSLENIGVDLTNIDKNIENLSAQIENIYDDLPKVTGENTEITLSPTKKGKMELTLKGNTNQFTTTGKNLLYNQRLPMTQASVQMTYENGIFGLNGTAAISSNAYIIDYTTSLIHLEAGESLTYYIERVSGTSPIAFLTYFIPDDGSSTEYNWGVTLAENSSSNKVVKTASKAGNVAYVQFFLTNGVTYNSQAKILVQKGNIETPTFEPYTGGIASPNPDYPQEIEVVNGNNEIVIEGKNLAYTG